MALSYVLYPEDNEKVFFEICKAFEKDYPHFKKKELLKDILDGELFQDYEYNNMQACISIARMWEENDIELTANFDVFNFANKIKRTILHAVRLDADTHKASPDYIHNCCFIVNNISDENLISKLACRLFECGCTCFSFHGRFAHVWDRVFDGIFATKYYRARKEKTALTVTAEDLQDFAEQIAFNVPRLPDFNYHCRVVYYDDERELSKLKNYLDILDAKD